jgi:hypothetical protein
MCKVMDKLNELAQTADKGWRSSLGVERAANIDTSTFPVVRHRWNRAVAGLSTMPRKQVVL